MFGELQGTRGTAEGQHDTAKSGGREQLPGVLDIIRPMFEKPYFRMRLVVKKGRNCRVSLEAVGMTHGLLEIPLCPAGGGQGVLNKRGDVGAVQAVAPVGSAIPIAAVGQFALDEQKLLEEHSLL